MTIPPWGEVQAELRVAVDRVVALLRSGLDATAPSVGSWDLGGVAMHLSQAWVVVPGLAADDLAGLYEVLPDRVGVAGRSVINHVSELAGVTARAVAADNERDLAVLADRIETRAAAFLATLDDEVATRQRPWLVDGIVVPLPVLMCHLLSETIVHGRDIAVAAGRPWEISRRTANLILDGFVIPTLTGLGAAAVNQSAAEGLTASFGLRLRGGHTYRVTIEQGDLTIEAPTGARVDCHLSADPVAFLLLAWGRTSQWSAIAHGDLIAWGRRPWLALTFRTLIVAV